MRITISTYFDITQTNVTRKFNKHALPLRTGSKTITNEIEWILARRQQSNLETIIQLISLRSQPTVTAITNGDDVWHLEFTIESAGVSQDNNDEFGILKSDFQNVPMLTDLTETMDLSGYLNIDENIWIKLDEI